MKRVIVDYAKLTHEILNLLVEKFPDGYDDSDIVRFKNAQNELVEAVEVRTEDTIYLVKISTKLADRIENYDEDDELAGEIDSIDGGLDIEDDEVSAGDDDSDSYKDTPDPEDEDDETVDVSEIEDEDDED